LLDQLPVGADALASVVRGLVVHKERLAPGAVAEARLSAEPRIVEVAEMLAVILRLDGVPLTVPRPPERRLVGHFRTTSVLLCSFLRHQGVAARVRAGFSVYYAEAREFYGDHWVTECRPDVRGGWRLVDAELDEATLREHGIDFDPMDVPRDQLIVAGEAWQRGRRDMDAWRWFGSQPGDTGERYVAGQLVRDVACLVPDEPSAFDDKAPVDLAAGSVAG
jgi:hypothetical protein